MRRLCVEHPGHTSALVNPESIDLPGSSCLGVRGPVLKQWVDVGSHTQV